MILRAGMPEPGRLGPDFFGLGLMGALGPPVFVSVADAAALVANSAGAAAFFRI